MKGKAMKIYHSSREAGSVLLATMIFVLAIAAFLVSYLVLVQNSNQTVARAQQWNSALALAEAGVEEGLANLNMAAISTSSNAISFSPIPPRSLNGGNYSVVSSATGVVTTITSTGVVSAPITGQAIARIVQVTAQRQALFSKGVISMTYIDMNGNSTASDSWNSHNTNQSVNGAYKESYYSGTNGDVAAVSGYVNIGNQTIKGDLFLGPGAYIQRATVTGTTYTDWNMQFDNITLPTKDDAGNDIIGIWPDAPGDSTGHTFTNGGYYIIKDNGPITVTNGVKVTLNVTKEDYKPTGLNIMGGITNAGTVVMYQLSGTLTLGGGSAGGAINNRPENFLYFGGANLTEITFGGSSDFIGVIYAPQADLKLNGGGAANNLMGSFLVKSVQMGGHYRIHYDTSLEGLYWGLFVAGTWRELSPP
jgi:hypothetical protein